MLTKLYPMVQFEKGTWEIDEFDCASLFLLEGTEKAMLIDCGMGIGDLRGAVEMITDKLILNLSNKLRRSAEIAPDEERILNYNDHVLQMPQANCCGVRN